MTSFTLVSRRKLHLLIFAAFLLVSKTRTATSPTPTEPVEKHELPPFPRSQELASTSQGNTSSFVGGSSRGTSAFPGGVHYESEIEEIGGQSEIEEILDKNEVSEEQRPVSGSVF